MVFVAFEQNIQQHITINKDHAHLGQHKKGRNAATAIAMAAPGNPASLGA